MFRRKSLRMRSPVYETVTKNIFTQKIKPRSETNEREKLGVHSPQFAVSQSKIFLPSNFFSSLTYLEPRRGFCRSMIEARRCAFRLMQPGPVLAVLRV